ncbi:MAG: SURF1 family cytochrome oxidase biogenesis protein [Actinomycetes bacterium]
MLRLATRPRWIAFGVLAVLIALACVRLGIWQLHRHQERTAFNATVEQGAAATPVPADGLLAPRQGVREDAEWRRVTLTGRFDVDRQLLIRNQPLEGQNGYHVLTPLVPADGPGLLVDRGWVPAGATAATVPDVPAPPSGQVRVTGRVHASVGGDEPADLAPAGQLTRVDVPTVRDGLPYPVYGGYVELTALRPAPAHAPAPIPPPELGIGPHLAYAVQWWIFAVIALVGWALLLRREARDEASETPVRETRAPAPTG